MIDLIYHLLSTDTDVNTTTAGRINAELRVQTEDTPAIGLEYVSSQDYYFNADSCKHYGYDIDVHIYTKTLAECDSLMKKVALAVDRKRGTYTLTTGNTYNVVNIIIQSRDIDVIEEAQMYHGQLSLQVTA